MSVKAEDKTPAERLAAELRLAIEARSTRPCFKFTYYDGAVTCESDTGVDDSNAIFTVLFEEKEYDVMICPNGADDQ